MTKHGGQLGGMWVAEAPGGVAAMLLASTAVSDHRLCAREAQSSSQHHHRGDGIFLRFWQNDAFGTRQCAADTPIIDGRTQ